MGDNGVNAFSLIIDNHIMKQKKVAEVWEMIGQYRLYGCGAYEAKNLKLSYLRKSYDLFVLREKPKEVSAWKPVNLPCFQKFGIISLVKIVKLATNQGKM